MIPHPLSIRSTVPNYPPTKPGLTHPTNPHTHIFLTQGGHLSKCWATLREMRSRGVAPNAFAYAALLKAFSAAQAQQSQVGYRVRDLVCVVKRGRKRVFGCEKERPCVGVGVCTAFPFQGQERSTPFPSQPPQSIQSGGRVFHAHIRTTAQPPSPFHSHVHTVGTRRRRRSREDREPREAAGVRPDVRAGDSGGMVIRGRGGDGDGDGDGMRGERKCVLAQADRPDTYMYTHTFAP